MNPNPEITSGETDMVVLTPADVSLEQVSSDADVPVSTDKIEDESFQAGNQNFQNN